MPISQDGSWEEMKDAVLLRPSLSLEAIGRPVPTLTPKCAPNASLWLLPPFPLASCCSLEAPISRIFLQCGWRPTANAGQWYQLYRARAAGRLPGVPPHCLHPALA